MPRIPLIPLPLTAKWVTPIWGSSDWSALTGEPTPDLPPVGELWLNDDRRDGSYVAEGPLTRVPLRTLVEEGGADLLGPVWAERKRLPILLKFLNPSKWLSVQLHPDNDHAPAGELGKYEAWHILSAGPGAEIILGLANGQNRTTIRRAADSGRWSDILRRQAVAAGESYFIPSGTVHALGPDMLLFEIQQNSDVTYRFYDWNRLDDQGAPRPLHFEEALANIRHLDPAALTTRPLKVNTTGGQREYLVACRHFSLSKLTLSHRHAASTHGRGTVFLTTLSGACRISSERGSTDLSTAQTAMLPAGMGGYHIEPIIGPVCLLESREPDLINDVAEPLAREGYSKAEIMSLAGPLGQEEFGAE